ncbi:hypothetical protein [Sinomonas sp. P10A9]|uniref:Uncharacterized protein n=1 Tax=Sinomonas puerhi TaxID=3238584 RepID=A0AB39L0K7_9MICC
MAARKSPLPADPGTPGAIIEAAEEDVRTAEEHAAALEAAARAGDDTVTADDVEAAHKNARWARIRRDAAEVKAKALADELARQAYADLLAQYLETACGDPSGEIAAILDQVRPALQQAIALVAEKNRAVYQIGKYLSNEANYRDPADGVMGYANPYEPATAYLEYQGRRAGFVPSTAILSSLLRPIKSELLAAAGGMADDFLKAL